jgi:CSLREA domain-containing protein
MKNAPGFRGILGVCLSAAPAEAQFLAVLSHSGKNNAVRPVSLKCLAVIGMAAGLPFLVTARVQAQAPPVEVSLFLGQNSNPVASATDQGAGDTDPKPDKVGFDLKSNCSPTTFVEVKGHALQSFPPAKPTPAGPASVLFDDVTLTNTCAQTQSGLLVVKSSIFAPINPFNMRVRLKGKYALAGDKPGGNVIGPNTFVVVNGSALDATGKSQGSGSAADGGAPGKAPEVLIGPRVNFVNVTAPVVQLVTAVEFTLDPQDRIVLKGSAATLGYTADQVITVTTAEDLPDDNPGAGCTGCSLRQAMVEADIPPPGVDSTAIHFNIPGRSIPVIKIDTNTSLNFGSMGNSVHPVIIDGTTQPGGAMVELDGSAASPQDFGGAPIVAFALDNTNSGVIGMDIHSFPNDAIQISASGAPTTGTNAVLENLFGTDPTGTIALGNGGDAVHILGQSSNVVMDNFIAVNVGNGIAVDGSAATGNLIQWNQEIGNATGILLTNGANNSQLPPTLTSASTDGFNVGVSGTAHSVANSQVTLNVFTNSKCDSTGAGQAEELLGLTLANTDANGDANFSDSYAANLPSGEVVTATVTDPDGNTSQLSECLPISNSNKTRPPVANAGSNQTVTVGTLVTLNGTASSDPNTPPLPLTFKWTQASGPTASLSGASTATPRFTPAVAGSYVFSLVVNNGALDSTPASVTITVNNKTQPPVANAGSNQTVTVGTLVTLNGTASSDPNTPPLPLTFKWTQTLGPAVSLSGGTTATPSFTPTQAGSYVFSLVVNNGVLDSTPASVTITVNNKTQPPVANAGSNQTVTVGTLVTLNGTASSDPNTPPLPLTFKWTQTSGPAVSLSGGTTATPSFTPTQAGSYVFILVVNNGVLDSTPASVTITAKSASPLQLIQSLMAEVQSLGLPRGIEQSLVSKLTAAENALELGQVGASIGNLRAFIHEVEAQSGKKIPSNQADTLIENATQIIASIEAA